MKQREVLSINFMFMFYIARWMVALFTGSILDLGGRF